MQQSRLRGAERHVEVLAERRADSPPIRIVDPPVAAPEETHTMDAPPATELEEALGRINSASLEAIEALTDVRMASRRWAAAQEQLAVAYRDAGLTEPGATNGTPEPVRLAVVASQTTPDQIETARRLSPVDALERNGTANGTGRPAYVQRMLDALVEANGDFTTAARTIGLKRSSLVGSMSKLRAREDLTDAERVVVARKRGGSR
jgi:hypothetical protein